MSFASLPGRRWIALVILSLLFVPARAFAHASISGNATITFLDDGSVQADLETDLKGILLHYSFGDVINLRGLNTLPEQTSEDQQKFLDLLVRMFRKELVFDFDIQKFDPANLFETTIEVPGFLEKIQTLNPKDDQFKIIVRFSGTVPQGARKVKFHNGEIHGLLMVRASGGSSTGQTEMILREKAVSESYSLKITGSTKPDSDQTNAGNGVNTDRDAPPSQGRTIVAWQYLVLGYEHILPRGLDHILFVLGLFFLSTKMKPLLWQITAFTIAHSITLGLAMYGLISLDRQIVESIIAISIVFVAVENICTSKLNPWRPVVVFLFGLLHGMGFAGVLNALGLPEDRFVTALITFNVGVELGQISIVLIAWALLRWFYDKPWYRRRVVIPASLIIALYALLWTIERVFDLDFIYG